MSASGPSGPLVCTCSLPDEVYSCPMVCCKVAVYQMKFIVAQWFSVLAAYQMKFIVAQWFAVLAAYQMEFMMV